MDKIMLTEEKETLLIPLYGKAMENKKNNPVLIDKKAAEIVNGIDYNFSSLKIAEKTNIMMCIRAKMIDDYVKNFLTKENENTVLHLGCGLDSRYLRVNADTADWYDVDFEDVINIRRNFYTENDKYHMIGSSVTKSEWFAEVSSDSKHNIVIAEGLFMYLKEDEIKTLINRLSDKLKSYNLIFDAYSTLTAKQAKNHPSLKKTGAKINWGIDDAKEFEDYGKGIEFIDEMFFSESKELDKLDAGTRMIFKTANHFSAAKKAHRILIYSIN